MRPGGTGAWAGRDIMAHVTGWEEEAVPPLALVLAGGRPPRYSVTHGGIDAFNAKMTEQRKHWSLAQVLTRQDEVHRRLIALVQDAPEEQLSGDARFRRRLRLDTYGHYPKHARAIRTWRASRAVKGDLPHGRILRDGNPNEHRRKRPVRRPARIRPANGRARRHACR